MRSLKIMWFTLVLSFFFSACTKDDELNPNNGGLGLELATFAETDGIPYTPNFLTSSLSPSVSLEMPPVSDQGNQGSCTSWSTAYAGMSYFMNRFNGTTYSSNNELCSPKYVYNQITQGNCVGTSIPSNLNLLMIKGVCTLYDMPYNDAECSSQPSSTQNTNAQYNKIFAWKMVDKNDLNVLKSCLAAKYPIYIAVNVDESFDNLQSPYIWSSKFGAIRGGHAVTVVGYDDNKNAFKVQNSWGNGWKDNGHLWISYNFFAQAVIQNECYIAFPQITGTNDNLSNGLVLNMPFSGNANDVSGNNNNGVVLGDATLTTDRKNNSNSAYKFGGYSSSGSIAISASPTLTINGDYSISFWVRFDSHQGDDGTGSSLADGNSQVSWQTIFYRGGNTSAQANAAYKILLSSQNNTFGWGLASNGGGQSSGAYSNVGEWHHYVISKVGNILKLYKDGILIWDLTNTYVTMQANNFSLNIGKSLYPGNGQPLNGAVDEFRIYNRALTASEVQKLFKL